MNKNNTSNNNQSSFIEALTTRGQLFLFSYSPQYRSLVSWSENAKDVLGVADAAIASDGNLFLRHVHPDDRFLLMTDLEDALKGNSPYRATYRWIRPDTNEIRWLHCRAAMNTDAAGMKVFEGYLVDLSEEFTGEVSRIAGPDSLQSVLSAFPTFVFTVDKDLRLIRINRSNREKTFHFGDPKFQASKFKIGRSLLDAISDMEIRDEYQSITKNILEGMQSHFQTRISSDDFIYRVEIHPLLEQQIIEGLLFHVTDISESVLMEQQIAQLHKAEGLGLLAAGVAHNFNNALQGILGHASVIQRHSTNIEAVKSASEAILDIVQSSSDLAKQLTNFQSDSSQKEEEIDINLITMKAVHTVQDIFASDIKVAVSFGSPLRVQAHKTELIKALEAILKNSAEALAKSDRTEDKHLSVKTSHVHLKTGEIADLKSGLYAKLTISDSGIGMAQEIQNRCFDPFYTTKERDIQTGVGIKPSWLGLSKTLAIIRSLGGTITVESKKNIGSHISVFIPAIKNKTLTAPFVPLKNSEDPLILVIDDDQIVLRTIQAMLKDIGYSCIIAEDAQSAFQLIRENKTRLRLVLLDAIMPGMDGPTVLKQIKKMIPTLPVIGFSGAAPSHTQALLDQGAVQILRKPVGSKDLKEAIEAQISSPKKIAANN